ncbi:MAG: murein biosynthesis integral membrane protein MurJ [Patescibacteria group bacterium]|nr:murein biosynthesis integral membrane protein MurJ [Patescibacteria group bacterium]
MVKNIFKNGVYLLSMRQTSILSAAFVIMSTVAVSKILGVVKLRMLSARFTPSELGVYLAAFRLPNLLFELLVLGALSAAFIPVFTGYLKNDDKEDAWHVASAVINIGLVVVFICSLPVLIFTTEISRLLAPGFSSSQIELMSEFTRLMIIGQVFPLVVGNFFTGMLQSFKHFLLPSLAPVLYDLGIIAGIFFLTPSYGLRAPVYGVILGAILFMLVQIPALFSYRWHHSFTFDYRHPGVREIGKLMLPRTMGLAVGQIDTTTDLILASLLGARSVTIFNFAQTLQQLPISLFGATIAQASLPTLSEEFGTQDLEKFKSTLLTSLHQILFLVFPTSALLIVLRVPVVRLAFGAKLFDWDATILTAQTLAFFSLSVFAQAIVQLLARAFYALHDSRTPVIIGIVSVLTNVFFSVLFIVFWRLPIWSLGLSTTIASLANALFLLTYLDKKVSGFDRIRLWSSPLKITLASIITGLFLYLPMKLLDALVFDTTHTVNLILLTGIAFFIGFSVYLILAIALKIQEAGLFLQILGKLSQFGQVISKSPEVIDGEKPNP